MIKIEGQTLQAGHSFIWGPHAFTEQEIIDFARISDPLPFHIDPAAAAQSHFGRIVASGPHLFSAFHRLHFIPRFGSSVLAGLSISNWTFLSPHYPDEPVTGRLFVQEVTHKPEKGIAIVSWKYEFSDSGGQLLQQADFQIMHRTDRE